MKSCDYGQVTEEIVTEAYGAKYGFRARYNYPDFCYHGRHVLYKRTKRPNALSSTQVLPMLNIVRARKMHMVMK